MSITRKLSAALISQIQRGFVTKSPGAHISKTLVINNSKEGFKGVKEEDVVMHDMFAAVKTLADKYEKDEQKSVAAGPVNNNNLGLLAFTMRFLNSTLDALGLMIEAADAKLEASSPHIKLTQKEHGYSGSVWVRSEGRQELSKIIFEGLEDRGEGLRQGIVLSSEVEEYCNYSIGREKIGYGGCGNFKDLMNFLLDCGMANLFKNDHTFNKNGFLIIALKNEMLEKDKLYTANLLCNHSRSYENEVLLVGDLKPEEMFAVIRNADLGRFLAGEKVPNMLSHNKALNAEEFISINDPQIAKEEKPTAMQLAKLEEAIPEFSNGIRVCVISNYAVGTMFSYSNIAKKLGKEHAPEEPIVRYSHRR